MTLVGASLMNPTIVRHHVGHALGLEHEWYAKLDEDFKGTTIMEYVPDPIRVPNVPQYWM